MINFMEVFFEETEMVCGLPGPNLFFRGTSNDYDKLSYIIEELMVGRKKIIISDIDFVDFKGSAKPLVFSSVDNGVVLGKMTNEALILELDPMYWRELFVEAVRLSRQTHVITVFCGDILRLFNNDIVEDINVIWEN
jgi:hypothetical protein